MNLNNFIKLNEEKPAQMKAGEDFERAVVGNIFERFASTPVSGVNYFRYHDGTSKLSFSSRPVVTFARPSFEQFRKAVINSILELKELSLAGSSKFDISLYVIKGKKFFGIGSKTPIRIFAQATETHNFQRNIWEFQSNESMFRVFEGISSYNSREKFSSSPTFTPETKHAEMIKTLNRNKEEILEILNFIPRENYIDILAVKTNETMNFRIIDPRRMLLEGSFTNIGTAKVKAAVDFVYNGERVFSIVSGKGDAVQVKPTEKVLQFAKPIGTIKKLKEQARIIEMPRNKEDINLEIEIPKTIDAKFFGITMPETSNAAKIQAGRKTIVLKKPAEQQYKKAVNESKK